MPYYWAKFLRQAINHCSVCISMFVSYLMYMHLLQLVASCSISKISPQTMRSICTAEFGWHITPCRRCFLHRIISFIWIWLKHTLGRYASETLSCNSSKIHRYHSSKTQYYCEEICRIIWEFNRIDLFHHFPESWFLMLSEG